MVWIAGEGRAGYDHPGEFNRVMEVEIQVDPAIVYDSAQPGSARAGLAMSGVTHKRHIVEIEVE